MANDQPAPTEELAVTIVLAEAAQVADGKLNLLGGGISVLPPRPQPMAVAILVRVPWSRAEDVIPWACELLGEDGIPVMAGDVPVLVNGQVAAGRPPGWPEGQTLPVPVVINFSALPVEPGKAYRWRLAVDGASDDAWVAEFSVAPESLTA
ncbi:MAG TPA: hypothetical protein VIY72_00020 [Acidimicrobiales bacterium]